MSVSAATAACCDTAAAFDVVCDCNAVIDADTARGAIAQPIRHPVIAYDFATPLIRMSRSRSGTSDRTDVAGASYAICR